MTVRIVGVPRDATACIEMLEGVAAGQPKPENAACTSISESFRYFIHIFADCVALRCAVAPLLLHFISLRRS